LLFEYNTLIVSTEAFIFHVRSTSPSSKSDSDISSKSNMRFQLIKSVVNLISSSCTTSSTISSTTSFASFTALSTCSKISFLASLILLSAKLSTSIQSSFLASISS
jgi:hypothetical protein